MQPNMPTILHLTAKTGKSAGILALAIMLTGRPLLPQHVHATAGNTAAAPTATGHPAPTSPAPRSFGRPDVPPTVPLTAPLLPHAPVIDGAVQPGEWDDASVVSGFVQREPHEGQAMSEQTVVKVARHGGRLFLLFLAYDREIAKVRAELSPRDRFERSADVVTVLLDPVQSKSRGYVFVFNPLGVQYDGIWSRQIDFGWDGVVESKGRVETDRYVVEVAIPFATVLTGGATGDTWNVNFSRRIPRRNEEGWWAPIPRAESWRTLAYTGELVGMRDAARRTRVELIPTATANGARARGTTEPIAATWGATVRAPLSDAVRLEATYQPDFTFVETDAPQIGFNERFALFYPEKRPFFLEAGDRFAPRAASFISDPLNLVHTRSIIQPRAGARILAAPEGAFLGGMVLTGEDDGTASVLRTAVDRADGTIAGLTATHRDHDGRQNTVVAGDAQAHLPADLVVTLQGARSRTREEGTASREGTAVYLDLARETNRGIQQVVYKRLSADFETDLGYVPRTDMQSLIGHAGYYWRPTAGPLQSVFPMTQNAVLFDAAGRRQEVEHLPHVEVLLTRNTMIWTAYRFGEEWYHGRDYRQARYELRISSTPRPWLDISLGGKTGRRIRYDVDSAGPDETFLASLREGHAEASIRPDRATTLSLTGVWRALGGNGTVAPRSAWVARLRAIRFLSRSDFIKLVAQYDPDAQGHSASLLLGRELNYGTQFHLGFDYSSARAEPNTPRVARMSFFTRVSYLLQR